MRLVKIPNCSYEMYEKMRDAIDTVIPFAVIDIRYDPKPKIAIVNFWDSDYIPEEMKKFIVQPPLSRENREKLTQLLGDIFK